MITTPAASVPSDRGDSTELRDWLIARYLRSREHPGKLRVAKWLGRMVVPDSGVVTSVPQMDLRLYLHPRDWIEYLLLSGTPYEPLTLEFLSRNLSAGDGAILAGTNFGLHVAVAARAVGADGSVIGVDPQPGAVLRTKLNLELNELQCRVRLLQAALGSEEAVVRMAWSSAGNSGAASLLDEGEGFFVSMLQLDSVIPLLDGRPLRVVLLDVQGYEGHALEGLDLAGGPEILIVEFDPEFAGRVGLSAADIVHRLRAAGYSLFDLRGTAEPPLAVLAERNLIAVKSGANIRWVC